MKFVHCFEVLAVQKLGVAVARKALAVERKNLAVTRQGQIRQSTENFSRSDLQK